MKLKLSLYVIFIILLVNPFISFASDNAFLNSHIKGNVPDESDFKTLLSRDLNNYFSNSLKKSINTEYVLLRDGPTQSGVAYPKYYLWVKCYNVDNLIIEGAVRIAAIEKTHFEITNFVSLEDIRKGKININEIFPMPVCKVIRTYINK